MPQLPGGEMQRPSQIVFLVRAWRPNFFLGALEHPGGSDLRQEVDIGWFRQHHHLMDLQPFSMPPNPGHAFHSLRVVIFGRQLGPFPHPADLVEPAAHGFGGHRDAMLGLACHGERGTAPAGPAPTIGPGGFFEEGTEGARQPGHQDSRLDSEGELTVLSDTHAQAPSAIRPHNPVHARARAKQECRNLRGVAAHRTEQQDMERQQIAIPCPAKDSTHLGLLGWRNLQYGCGRHSEGSLIRGYQCKSNVSYEYLTVLMSCGSI